LTGLWNRRMGFRLLAHQLRQGVPYRLTLLDLDKFKEVNDRHGHAVGDEVLQAVASRLLNRFRRFMPRNTAPTEAWWRIDGGFRLGIS